MVIVQHYLVRAGLRQCELAAGLLATEAGEDWGRPGLQGPRTAAPLPGGHCSFLSSGATGVEMADGAVQSPGPATQSHAADDALMN